MRVAICDDDKESLNLLEFYIKRYGTEHNVETEIYTYSTALAMEDSCKQNTFDLIFLDIYISDQSGIEIAEKLKESYKGKIVFVTSSREYAVDAFRLHALNYLVKPIHYEQIEECFQRMGKDETVEILKVKCGYKNMEIPQKVIQYIESYNNTILIHAEQQEFITYENLTSLFEKLNHEWFIRPYRSYIVNMDYIDDFQNNKITLKNKVEVFVSRQKKAEAMKQYNQFMFRKMMN